MNILAIEAAGNTLQLAVKTISSFSTSAAQTGQHTSELIIPRILEVCEAADITMKQIEMVTCTNGPGSFTSLRVAMATAKGICFANSIPLVSIGTLDVYHYPVKDVNIPIVVALDAKKQRYYCTLFECGRKIMGDLDATVAEFVPFIKQYRSIYITGPDANEFAQKLSAIVPDIDIQIDILIHRNYCEGLMALALSEFVRRGADDISTGPTYIRKSDAEMVLEKKLKAALQQVGE